MTGPPETLHTLDLCTTIIVIEWGRYQAAARPINNLGLLNKPYCPQDDRNNLTEKSSDKNRARYPVGVTMVLGAGVGLLVGVVIGTGEGSSGMGIPFGLIGGAAVGLLAGRFLAAWQIEQSNDRSGQATRR
jgi:F0F1-type ATP synthase assembly protein I